MDAAICELSRSFRRGALMTIFEIEKDLLQEVPETKFSLVGLRERTDLQRLFRDRIEVVSRDTLVIAEEFSNWEDSRRRIDLLGIDKNANLVVIELKRTDDGGHMELQAVRYAAMVSTLKFDQCVKVFDEYLTTIGKDGDAREMILDFLDWEEPNEDQFAQSIRIVLVSAEFSKEITTSVMWLNDQGLDIRCVRLKPHTLNSRVLLDVQQVIPLPEAAQYQVQIREKKQQERLARSQNWDQESFLQQLAKSGGEKAVALASEILFWITPLVDKVTWGERVLARMTPTVWRESVRYQLFVIRTAGRVGIRFRTFHSKKPFDNRESLEQLRLKFNEIPGVSFPTRALEGKPNFKLDLLSNPVAMEKFKNVIQWMIKTIEQG
jgi:hypothetical protein